MTSTTLTAADIIRSGRRLRRELLAQQGLHPVRVAMLGGSTTNELCDFLEIVLLRDGFQPTFYQSEYGAFFDEAVLDTERLIAFAPDVVIVHTSVRNIRCFPAPEATSDDVAALVDSELSPFREVWRALTANIGCQIVQNNFELPAHSVLGNLDASHLSGRVRYINALNAAMAADIAALPRVILQDIATLSARMGLVQWVDAARWFSYKLAHTPDAHLEIARSLSSMFRALYGRARKCLVLDLDNTLWGGVIGDDGVDRIQIGRETAAAEAFTAFQEYCLELRRRGVLLAVCSKNNDEVARTGLAHPDSVLRIEHFSAFRANWQPKHENIQSIAAELNLGVDSFVFVDDNPAERALVAAQLPAVAVPDVGNDVTRYATIIDRERYFETVGLSADDLQRAAQYQANSQRASVSAQFADYGAYLTSLEMVAEVDAFQPVYLDRIAQLTNKTNQFNLTTRRYSLAEMQEIAANPASVTLYGRLTDRFGDNGLVSVVAGTRVGDAIDIDLWLMSCRVLKREMEVAMLDALVERSRAIGASRLIGHYIPTPKNGMVADHFSKLGFTQSAHGAVATGTTWELDISGYTPRCTTIHIKRYTP
jgi:FkbH-like protein